MPKDHYRCLTVRFSPTFDESPSVIITEREEDKDVVDSCQRFLHWETTFEQIQRRLAHDLVDGMGEAAVGLMRYQMLAKRLFHLDRRLVGGAFLMDDGLHLAHGLWVFGGHIGRFIRIAAEVEELWLLVVARLDLRTPSNHLRTIAGLNVLPLLGSYRQHT